MNVKRLKTYLKKATTLGLCVLLLSGCQPTPDTEAIARKDDINKVVEQYAEDDIVGETTGEALRQSIGAPETASFEVTVENVGDGSTKVTADHVPVILPNADKLGSAAIVRTDLTAEQIKAMAERFFEGRTAYEQGAGDKGGLFGTDSVDTTILR